MSSVKTATVQEIAQGFYCPSCKSKGRRNLMVPMAIGGGLRCGSPGNRWDGKNKKWSICNTSIWLQSPNNDDQFIVRPQSFPEIITPTHEQVEIDRLMGLAPSVRGGRFLSISAGPGTGKTSTMSWSLRKVYQRLGNLDRYFIGAFGRNARDVLLSKLPYFVGCIVTLNGGFGKLQGFRYEQYDDEKIWQMFSEMIAGIKEEDRPEFCGMDGLIDKFRAWCVYDSQASNFKFWEEAILSIVERFGLQEYYDKNKDVWHQYIPSLMVQAQQCRQKIDLAEQWSFCATQAAAKMGWHIPLDSIQRGYQWTDENVKHFAALIRATQIGSVKGFICDEAQDLSLGQIVCLLASTWRTGELVIIGDDRTGNWGDENFKAGQGIFGWRGAFAGSMPLIGRLWTELTGEKPIERPLSISQRCYPEIIDAFRNYNKILTSARPRGIARAMKADRATALGIWFKMPVQDEQGLPYTALWITRTQKEAASVMMATIKARVPCGFRGGDGFERQLNGCFYGAAGQRGEDGEYKVSLEDFIAKLKEIIEEKTGGRPERGRDLKEFFIQEVSEEIQKDPSLLKEVELLPHYRPTPGNIRRFILAFADKNAARIISNIYRAKGDEARWCFMSDADQFNKAWGGDEDERQACVHTAASRGMELLVCVGNFVGMILPEIEVDGTEVPAQNDGEKHRVVSREASQPKKKRVYRRKPKTDKADSKKKIS